MRQNTVVGVLATGADLSLYPHTQPGLHYARHVLACDLEAGQPLPQTGRGRAVAARSAGSVRLHRMTVCWGTDAAVRDSVLASDRPCVVAVVRGRSTARACAALLQAQAAGREVHLLAVGDRGAWRVIGSDAGRAQVQVCVPTGWELIDSTPSAAPATPDPAPPPPDPAPATPDPMAQPADTTAVVELQENDDAPASD